MSGNRQQPKITLTDNLKPSSHCLTLTPWDADGFLSIGEYRGYFGAYKIDFGSGIIYGVASALGLRIGDFQAITPDAAILEFRNTVDDYIEACQHRRKQESAQ